MRRYLHQAMPKRPHCSQTASARLAPSTPTPHHLPSTPSSSATSLAPPAPHWSMLSTSATPCSTQWLLCSAVPRSASNTSPTPMALRRACVT